MGQIYETRLNPSSSESFVKQAPVLASIEARVVDWMTTHGETRTRQEIAKHFGIATATMSGRIRAMLDKGKLVEETGRFHCGVSGNQVRGVTIA